MADLVQQMQRLAAVHGLAVDEVIAAMHQHHAADGGDALACGSQPDKTGLNMVLVGGNASEGGSPADKNGLNSLIPFEAETQITATDSQVYTLGSDDSLVDMSQSVLGSLEVASSASGYKDLRIERNSKLFFSDGVGAPPLSLYWCQVQ